MATVTRVCPPESLVGLGADDLLAAIIAARADVMPQVNFTAHRLDGQRGFRKEIVRAMHAALRGRFLVLLDCHHALLVVIVLSHAPSGWHGANGSASTSSSSTSVSGSTGPGACTTSELLFASSAAISRSSWASSTSVRWSIGHWKSARQRWQVSVTAPFNSMPSAGRPDASALPSIRHPSDAGASDSRSAVRENRCGSTLPSTTPRSRARRNGSNRPGETLSRDTIAAIPLTRTLFHKR